MSKPKARLYVASPLQENTPADLTPGQAHYLKNVMRMGPGDKVAVFNGRDGEWLSEIETLGKKSGTLRTLELIRAQISEPDIWLLFAPIKKHRLDFVVEKATELGVSALHPVITQHTAVSRVNLDRLKANCLEAAEQCERLSLPHVAAPESLENKLAGWPSDRQLFVLDETGAGDPINTALQKPQRAAALLIGPEGGFSLEELEALRQKPFVTSLSLGSRILRADTAAVAALSCWQALAGDWQK